MGKASNQGDGVIACTGASLPAAGQCPACLWSGGLGPGLGRELAEASFLLRLLMAPSGHPTRTRGDALLSSDLPAGGGCPGTCHQLGLTQPGSLCASLALWPGPHITLEEFVPRGFRKALC